MTKPIRVLLVEDEEVLAAVVKETLELRGFDIEIARNGVDGWAKFHSEKPDVCVVDVMMPRKDGYELVIDIRRVDEWIPIIFLTAKTQTADVLKGLEAGADDYMKKPFSMEELILRLKRLTRRKNDSVDTNIQNPLSSALIGTFYFDFERLELTGQNGTANLSQREAELLHLLLSYKNRLVDRKTALLKIWGDDNVFNTRSMDVYITRLRKYLAADTKVQIINIRGQGYKLLD